MDLSQMWAEPAPAPTDAPSDLREAV